MIPKETLLQLQQAERTVTEFYPYISEAAALETEKNSLSEKLAKEKKSEREYKTATIVCAAVGLICVILWISASIAEKDVFFPFWSVFMFWIMICALIFFAVFLIYFCTSRSKVKKTSLQIVELDGKIYIAAERLDRKSTEMQESLVQWSDLMPKETIDPKYARVFIEYLEQNRANTLGEARNLFDEFIHRERMEQLAKEQIETAKRAEEAANKAAQKATYAAIAAQNAANAANQRRF